MSRPARTAGPSRAWPGDRGADHRLAQALDRAAQRAAMPGSRSSSSTRPVSISAQVEALTSGEAEDCPDAGPSPTARSCPRSARRWSRRRARAAAPRPGTSARRLHRSTGPYSARNTSIRPGRRLGQQIAQHVRFGAQPGGGYRVRCRAGAVHRFSGAAGPQQGSARSAARAADRRPAAHRACHRRTGRHRGFRPCSSPRCRSARRQR
jgi:hypothetical protein